MGRDCLTLILLLILDVVSSYNVVRKDPFASLSETLVTRQRAACDGDILVLECPARTKISIQLVIYGRSAPSSQVCPPTNKQPRVHQDQNAFGFSTLTRNKSKSSGRSCPVSNVDQYLLQGDQKDSVVRYSTIGRNSRGHQNLMRGGVDFNNASGNFEPKSLNLSQENDYLYY